jgi:ComF family protein
VVAVRGFLSFVLDTLSPALCVHCGAGLTGHRPSDGLVLTGDWPPCTLTFFIEELGADVLCPDCWLRLQPSFGEAAFSRVPRLEEPVPVISPFYTNDTLLSLVRFLKFGGGTSIAFPLSWWMSRILERFVAGPSERILLVPVPLHWTRLWRRGYNQGTLLARGVARELNLRVDEGIVVRNRRTRRQANLKGPSRRSNVRNAFSCRNGASVRGADIVLVDDLVTSGETVRYCLEPLLSEEPRSLIILAAGHKRQPPSP